MSKEDKNLTRWVNFTDYKEEIYFDSGYSPVLSFVSVLVIAFFVFYLVFGVNDPIEVFDVLVNKVKQFAKLSSVMGKAWEEFRDWSVLESDYLEFNGIVNEIPKDWSDHFLSPGEMFKAIFGMLFPKNVGVS